ncbi:hypothetical protein PC116_g14035 [Phytophthora cactorum]|uniref:Uncharacterized protein n=1 Tax=Phytophthora cactorum TaxID=29920 RepID=A0A8T1FV09_9STRA|nr:hypothetical protein PC115_g10858 [Phytophthora cactorum]KAG2980461.1 hypothetical protein PC118_g11162 [Phytophthora cactorum]KAG4056939.1 hypothetical protein PC123_g8024 [Phytophthora cactorum]KAG4237903.1 hypothetical protein PC116_g14035 [Phytophthora cactorum]
MSLSVTACAPHDATVRTRRRHGRVGPRTRGKDSDGHIFFSSSAHLSLHIVSAVSQRSGGVASTCNKILICLRVLRI